MEIAFGFLLLYRLRPVKVVVSINPKDAEPLFPSISVNVFKTVLFTGLILDLFSPFLNI